MLYAFAFERIGIVVGDIYFVNPRIAPRHEGPEQGVRVEVRWFEREEPPGSVYSAQPVVVGRPVWRVDLLESVGHPGTVDRAHYHPRFEGWEPGPRHFAPELSADPLGWLRGRLTNLGAVLDEAGVGRDELGPGDVPGVARTAGEVVAAVERLLDGVRASGIGATLPATSATGVRVGWL